MCKEALKNMGSGIRAGAEETDVPGGMVAPMGGRGLPVKWQRGGPPTKLTRLGHLLGSLLRGAGDALPGRNFQEGAALAEEGPLIRRLRRERDEDRRTDRLRADEAYGMRKREFERSMSAPRFQPGQPFELETSEGEPVAMERDPETGQPKPLGGGFRLPGRIDEDFVPGAPGYTAMKKRGKLSVRPTMVDVPPTSERDGSAAPFMIARPTNEGLAPVSEGQETTDLPRLPSAARQVPLTDLLTQGKLDKKPKAIMTSERDTQGVERSYFIDGNPDSPTFGQRMVGGKPVSTRQPAPDRQADREARVERLATTFLEKAKGSVRTAINALALIDEKTIPSELRKRLRDRIRDLGRLD